jgi:hypothetical protein
LFLYKFNQALEIPAVSSNRYDDQYHRSSNNVTSDDNTPSGGFASIDDLFDFSSDGEYSIDGNSLTSVEDHFSPLKQDDRAGDNDTIFEPAPEETRDKIWRDHCADSGRTRQDNIQSKLGRNRFFPI